MYKYVRNTIIKESNIQRNIHRKDQPINNIIERTVIN